ncbi:hypothetical protein [Heyndrickxia shackletonii]|uniref:hypothetical protein n=1 Tax=Heyndrickxia shackletonii TaxID=157838 RepID=UPI0013D6B2FA|nr:hypothetical protein [Heyndrickxia shackletonii]
MFLLFHVGLRTGHDSTGIVTIFPHQPPYWARFSWYCSRYSMSASVLGTIPRVLFPLFHVRLGIGHDSTGIVTIFPCPPPYWARFSWYCSCYSMSTSVLGTIPRVLLPFLHVRLGTGHDSPGIVPVIPCPPRYWARFHGYCYHFSSSATILGTILLVLFPLFHVGRGTGRDSPGIVPVIPCQPRYWARFHGYCYHFSMSASVLGTIPSVLFLFILSHCPSYISPKHTISGTLARFHFTRFSYSK